MVKCTVCKKELREGTGTMYVKKDGTTYYFCSKKCELNILKLKRKPTNLKWANTSKKSKKEVKEKK